MSLHYSMVFTCNNENNTKESKKDVNNKNNNEKHNKKLRKSQRIQDSKKEQNKKGRGANRKRSMGGNDNGDSESEYDYDYSPSESGSGSESESETEFYSDSETAEEDKEQFNKRKPENDDIFPVSKRPKRQTAKIVDYEESDTDKSDTDKNDLWKMKTEEEYENYLEKIISEFQKKMEPKEDEKENTAHIFVIGKSKENKKLEEKKHGYNLRDKPDTLDGLTFDQRKKIEETEKALFELNRYKIPPRHKVLLADMTLASKAKIIGNMDRMDNMNSYSSEYTKLGRWIEGVLKIPFGTYYELPISLSSPNKKIQRYLTDIETTMDKCIYGQRTAKEKILEFVGKWITNPNSTNEPLAFIGEKGTGKTTLAKEGISKALGRPFYMISLGGESDAASFKGHDYTYEGSRWGRIADILIATQCMNPVIFFDELDKLSTTRAGEEIAGMLMHLTDTTQNDKFSDKYFSGIDLDLSKALFIFSYNDPDKLNPILRDRLTEIKFNSFKKEDKLVIARDFLIKRACSNIGLNIDNYIFNDKIILKLIESYTPREESGVRNLKRVIETLFLRLNLHHLPQDLNISYKNMTIKKENGKNKINESVVAELLKDMMIPKPISEDALSMYM